MGTIGFETREGARNLPSARRPGPASGRGTSGSLVTVSGRVAEARIVRTEAEGLLPAQSCCVLTVIVDLADVSSTPSSTGIAPGCHLDLHTRQTDLTLLVGGRLTATIAPRSSAGDDRLWLVDILAAARPR